MNRTRFLPPFALLLVIAVSACRPGEVERAPVATPVAAEPAAVSTAVPPEIRTVILVSLDTTRWDAVSCYGADERITPNLAALCREGVVFERAYAPSPVTLPSHASMLTGLEPPAHGIFDNGRYSLGTEHRTLAEAFAEHGYATGAFVSALVLDSRFGLDRGFDTYDDEIGAAAVIGERRGDLTTARALAWLEEHRAKPSFLFLHLFDPHAPYEAPEAFVSTIERIHPNAPEHARAYLAEVAFVDHCVGLLLTKLRELGLYDQSLICITADHGESQGEHGENTHGYFIYSSTTRVPLVLKVPGRSTTLRVAAPAGVVDIAPTIASLLGLGFDPEIQGRDLGGSILGRPEPDPGRALTSISLEPRKYGGSSLLGIVAGDIKYIQAPRPELYDLVRDPYETTNLAASQPQLARELRERLQLALEAASSAALPEQLAVDNDTIRKLQSLGYVMVDESRQSAAADQAALDPKDLIEYHKRTLVAMSYVAPENLGRAEAACRDMIEMRPDFYLGYFLMGKVLVAADRQDEAYRFFERSHALSPKQPAGSAP
jgi:arylsulfatase A-like enzyme